MIFYIGSSDLDGMMAQKKFLSWVGFKDEATTRPHATTTPSLGVESSSPLGSQSNVARIRELENQLAELRSRRDLTSLTKEEFEILASETAMTMIKTAQSRESKALAASQKLLNESNRSARELIESAEAKAKSLLAQAESRGRKYIDAAENDAAGLIAEAEREAEQLINSKKREASALTSAAKRDAEALVSGAVTDISDYRSWLTSAISEAERLHRIQTQSLNAAEQAIEQTRQRLSAAFEKLASLQGDIDANLNSDNRPKGKNYVRTNGSVVDSESIQSKQRQKKVVAKKSAAKKSASKKAVAKKTSAKRK
jgi:hypothetical protein